MGKNKALAHHTTSTYFHMGALSYMDRVVGIEIKIILCFSGHSSVYFVWVSVSSSRHQ